MENSVVLIWGSTYAFMIYILIHAILMYWIRSLEDSTQSPCTGRLPYIANFVLERLYPLFYSYI